MPVTLPGGVLGTGYGFSIRTENKGTSRHAVVWDAGRRRTGASRGRECLRKGRGGHAAGMGGSRGGVCRPPPPVVQERRERAAKARRNGRGFCAPSAPSRHGDNARYPLRAFCSGARRYGGRHATRACYFTPKACQYPPFMGRRAPRLASEAPVPPRPAKPWARAARFAFCGQGPI
jgi:hypothetical protein